MSVTGTHTSSKKKGSDSSSDDEYYEPDEEELEEERKSSDAMIRKHYDMIAVYIDSMISMSTLCCRHDPERQNWA